MALDSYAGLKAELQSWLHRSDLSNAVDTFIDLCESRLNRELRLLPQEIITTLAVVSEDTALPADFLEFRHLAVSDSPDKPLQFMSADQMALRGYSSGTPRFYTILGDYLRVAPVAECTLNIVYFAKIAALSDGNQSNFVLLKHPELYLYGSLLQAEPYLMNDERIPVWKTLFSDALALVVSKDEQSRYGGSPLMVRAR